MEPRKLQGSVAEIAAQLRYVNGKVVEHYMEVYEDHTVGHLRRVGAAALIRVSHCLEAAVRLADAKLGLEADTIVRTIVELAIPLCWVGLDEERAQAVWDKSIVDFGKGLDRVSKREALPREIAEWRA